MLTDLQKAKLKELQEGYLTARLRGRKSEADFWNKEITNLLIEALSDTGNPETTRGTDTGER